MKKVLSNILILVIVFANLFAPISIALDSNNQIKIEKNIASASTGGMKVSVFPGSNSNSITVQVNVYYEKWSETLTGVRVVLKDLDLNTVSDPKEVNFSGSLTEIVEGGNYLSKGKKIIFSNLRANSLYEITTISRQVNPLQIGLWTTYNFNGLWVTGDDYDQGIKENSLWEVVVKTLIRTTAEGETIIYGDVAEESNAEFQDIMPTCIFSDTENGSITGCFAQLTYYVLFVPSSYLFALSGVFFDNTFAYSVQDSSYRSSFVVEGWGLIRDFSNLFFIFILLYIAIGTILRLHSVKTKETIINVIIIGLFINFSLFATQVIIDASNITARVFYNSDAIKITTEGQTDNTLSNATSGGDIIFEEKPGGVINLSEALVNKINPQNIIINSKKVQSYYPKGSNDVVVKNVDKGGISAGQFILITLIAVAINVIGFLVFLSVGLIFVTRVIGLWLAMILSPIAFFTYITPGMAKTKMIGWKNWWPETLKLAFLAPVFIFFMFIILKFLELDLISDAAGKSGLNYFVAAIIPFAFIMILLLKAKSIAKDMSGEIGQQITKGVSAVGSMALGGAALIATGGASAAMKGAGGVMNKIQNSKAAQEYHDQKMGGLSMKSGFRKVVGGFGYRMNKSAREKEENIINSKNSQDLLNKRAEKLTGKKGQQFNHLSDNRKNKIRDDLKKGSDDELHELLLASNKKYQTLNTKGNTSAMKAMRNKNDFSSNVSELERSAQYKPSTASKIGDAIKNNDAKALKNSSPILKVGTNLMSGIANGIRLGLKEGMGITADKNGDFTSILKKFVKEVSGKTVHEKQSKLVKELNETMGH